jgi:hypothetical protein
MYASRERLVIEDRSDLAENKGLSPGEDIDMCGTSLES